MAWLYASSLLVRWRNFKGGIITLSDWLLSALTQARMGWLAFAVAPIRKRYPTGRLPKSDQPESWIPPTKTTPPVTIPPNSEDLRVHLCACARLCPCMSLRLNCDFRLGWWTGGLTGNLLGRLPSVIPREPRATICFFFFFSRAKGF